MPLQQNLDNRAAVVAGIRQELEGPLFLPNTLPENATSILFPETDGEVVALEDQQFGPFFDSITKEEVIEWDRPTSRYMSGVLFPKQLRMVTDDATHEGVPQALNAEEAQMDIEVHGTIQAGGDTRGESDNTTEYELSGANQMRPSTMGISFLAEVVEGGEMIFRFTGATYTKHSARRAGRLFPLWRRRPFTVSLTFQIGEGSQQVNHNIEGGNAIRVNVVARPISDEMARERGLEPESSLKLLTVAVTNISNKDTQDENCFFQSEIRVDYIAHEVGGIKPYLGPPRTHLDEEEQLLELLYRNTPQYAVGHGCAADWEDSGGRVSWVSGTPIPLVELPSTTPDIRDNDGNPIVVEIVSQIDEIDFDALSRIGDGYGQWIDNQRKALLGLNEFYQRVGTHQLERCDRAHQRILEGIECLRADQQVQLAWKLANQAILWQQQRARLPIRSSPLCDQEYPVEQRDESGKWRAFQIAFMLMVLPTIVNPDHPDRECVELLWFPTGGGKTEAYLGIAALSILLRRLRGLLDGSQNENAGTEVITRYTLRLLTTQQFERTTRLVCALEYLRQTRDDLGQKPFKIGFWSGLTDTKRDKAIENLRTIARGNAPSKTVCILTVCPWCGAKMGEVIRPARGVGIVTGYTAMNGLGGHQTVVVHCPDERCRFAAQRNRMPVEFIDEEIYSRGVAPCSIIIGTIDKFAMLAWRPEARRLFGINNDGVQEVDPPGLIIQDELHLISGPLGSMAGLYEWIIEDLCTKNGVKPKIIASTATIRRASDQIVGLYGRANHLVFPPSGIEASDSFFAQVAKEPDGQRSPGRLHVGILSVGSMQTTQTRLFATLHQTANSLENPDPFWTNLIFYNSLRELGGALTLFQSDVPDYIHLYRRIRGKTWDQIRRLGTIQELTSRLPDSEIRPALEALATAKEGNGALDVCLASNIIEVGVDIGRLSMMSIVGQPKTTAQYIQVAGRVGREWSERPGVVFTVYSAAKSRDRSHFEKFRTYHETLYAQVEPTSVTPFAAPVLSRALLAVLVVWLRMKTPTHGQQNFANTPNLKMLELLAERKDSLVNRLASVDARETESAIREFDLVMQFLKWRFDHDATAWGSVGMPATVNDLLRWPGSNLNQNITKLTPSSLRNVDLSTRANLGNPYMGDGN